MVQNRTKGIEKISPAPIPGNIRRAKTGAMPHRGRIILPITILTAVCLWLPGSAGMAGTCAFAQETMHQETETPETCLLYTS